MLGSYLWLILDDARMPLLVAPGFLAVIVATSYRLGIDLSRSTELSDRLQQAELRSTRTQHELALAATVGGPDLWTLDVTHPAAAPASPGPPTNDAHAWHSPESLLARVHAIAIPAVRGYASRSAGWRTGHEGCRVPV
jgi:hypothetical protein